ncbi:MAG: PilX N-terminal domain-containing pilus assembly protein [Steroidobacteraceae bacterium]|jgi:type IV pilus assembly protein PilX
MRRASQHDVRHREAQRGMVLITALLLLIVVTILAVGMFRSFGLDEKIAGNVREKHRAVNAAETAEEYAEWWLANGNGGAGSGVVCAPPLVSATTGEVCSNVLTNAWTLPMPWTNGVAYAVPASAPPSMVITPTNGLGPSAQNSFYYAPTFYISYLGQTPNGLGTLYQIDAAGYAGSPDTTAVVESTYLVQQSVRDLGGL